MKQTDSDKILAWLSDHPGINLSWLARATGMNRQSLQQAMEGKNYRQITPKYIQSFKNALKHYGYK